MKRRTFLTLLISVILLTAAAAAKKPAGKISDLAAFSQIHSYCVDSSSLLGDEAIDLNGFVSAESKPKKLLTKLPWTLVSDCSQGPPDGVVRVVFTTYSPMQVGPPPTGSDRPETESDTVRIVLRVSQGTSSQIIYENEAAPLSNSLAGETAVPVEEPLAVQRYNASDGAFWKLIQDAQRVSQTNSK